MKCLMEPEEGSLEAKPLPDPLLVQEPEAFEGIARGRKAVNQMEL